MTYTYEQLHKMTVAELRKIAEGVQHDAVHGFSTMHKEKLLPALCTALGIEAHTHHHVVGVNKTAVKAEIKKLKAQRAEALKSTDRSQYKEILHRIHELKRTLRKATVAEK
jgi:hypothetical protein